MGWGHTKIVYKAPEDITKPQSIIHIRHEILYSLTEKDKMKIYEIDMSQICFEKINAGPNPTPMNTLDEHAVKIQKTNSVRNGVIRGGPNCLVA